MKKRKYYTLILTSNSPGAVQKLSFSEKTLRIFLTAGGCFLTLLVLLLTDYMGLADRRLEISSLRDKNARLREQFARVTHRFQDLRREVSQLKDFNHKIHLIANLGFTSGNPYHLSYGKTSTHADLIRLARPDPPPLLKPADEEEKCQERGFFHSALFFGKKRDLEVKIKSLKRETGLIKQDTWNIYTALLKSRNLLNDTPSILPIRGAYRVTSPYGFRNETVYVDHEPQFHNGVDIAALAGSPVVATANGCVQFTGYDEDGYGKLVVIDHGHDVKTYYAHLSEIKVKSGQCIKRGETIASVGNTGKSTGPHLHYEVRVLGTPVNPRHYILNETPVFSPLAGLIN